MVVLVPRQIRLAGITGEVPYYGGRFTPAQAYAAAHPPRPPAQPPAAAQRPVMSSRDRVNALRRLLESGVLTQQEFDMLSARVER